MGTLSNRLVSAVDPARPDTRRVEIGRRAIAQAGGRVHGIVVLHLEVDLSKRRCVGDRAHSDVVAPEGFSRRLQPCRCSPGYVIRLSDYPPRSDVIARLPARRVAELLPWKPDARA